VGGEEFVAVHRGRDPLDPSGITGDDRQGRALQHVRRQSEMEHRCHAGKRYSSAEKCLALRAQRNDPGIFRRFGVRSGLHDVLGDMHISLYDARMLIEAALEALRAVAEETRLRIVAVLRHGELTVTDLTEILGQSQPRVSRHLRLLVDAGLLVGGEAAEFGTRDLEFSADDASALGPDVGERPDLLFRLAVALHRSYNEARQQDALEAARDALLSVGDAERASEAESFLARVFWERGQHDLVGQARLFDPDRRFHHPGKRRRPPQPPL